MGIWRKGERRKGGERGGKRKRERDRERETERERQRERERERERETERESCYTTLTEFTQKEETMLSTSLWTINTLSCGMNDCIDGVEALLSIPSSSRLPRDAAVVLALGKGG